MPAMNGSNASPVRLRTLPLCSLYKLAKPCEEENHHTSVIGTLLLVLMLLCVNIYGGFFNAGLDIIILSITVYYFYESYL